ncbi:MAG: magnesium chelatase subunit H [Alphaproteobacteria bacterium]|nr:magnesium chelatase subunit H [Alphaproteobacteria bacterium]
MPKPISGNNAADPATVLRFTEEQAPGRAARQPKASDALGRNAPIKVVIVTLDSHLAGPAERAKAGLLKDIPGLEIAFHAGTDWEDNPAALARCRHDIATGDIILACMLFVDSQIQAILPDLQARRDHCDAMIACVSAGEVIKTTRLGRLSMAGEATGPLALLKKLRGSGKKKGTSGAGQMAMLRRLPRILRFIPGTAHDLRAYFLTMQYWLAGSEENIGNMIRFLVNRYASGPREALKGSMKPKLPVDYPDCGVYHPDIEGGIGRSLDDLPKPNGKTAGTVGLLIMRSYVVSGDSRHYDAVIRALEARKLRVIPVFAAGLDCREAVDSFFLEKAKRRQKGKPIIDAMVSLTGFSLVGGPAYNDAAAAEEMLAHLDVPYIAAHAIEFQTLEQWRDSSAGLQPVEATIMVAIPELEGATSPTVFGGRAATANDGQTRDMRPETDRVESLADRVAKRIALRRSKVAERKIAVVLFNFPPNAGATGTAAYLSVFASLHNTLKAMAAEGYDLGDAPLPETVDDLRVHILEGNSAQYGTDAHVEAKVSAEDHVRREPHLAEIEAQWGPAPGKQLADSRNIFVMGRQFGNVFVGIQPAFGYEGDPMRLLFEKGFSPTHAFSAFYRYLTEEFGAHAVLHFGTHGALEFMPGKQAGLGATCWPERLIGTMPNFYLYAANNPSEGTIAKRRSHATIVTYLTPPVASAGLYKDLIDLKSSVDRWRGLPLDEESARERASLVELIHAQANGLELTPDDPITAETADVRIAKIAADLNEMEHALIPQGLHVVGGESSRSERADMLAIMAETTGADWLDREAVEDLANGIDPRDLLAEKGLSRDADAVRMAGDLATANRLMQENSEIEGLLTALEGRYIRPVPGGDLIRTPQILPTGRNLHGFDPYRIPSAYAVADGARQAQKIIERHMEDGNGLPRSIALVLWGTDNLKTEGAPIAQALALMGAEPRFDSYGRLAGAQLIPLDRLGRPRIDVVATLSGICRDLLPLQTKMLAEAAWLAASAEDEPVERNFVRANALAHMKAHGCDLEEAALRVFSNADGAYGANVNYMVDNGTWEEEDELADVYTKRKCFAYGRNGKPVEKKELLEGILQGVSLAYQNLESVELGVTTIDHYFDTLGGIGRAIQKTSGEAAPVYIGDQTRGEGKVRTLNEQIALETRTRMLNPKWYESLLEHGHEGVRQIEAHLTNTVGWSATTGQVDPWVYQELTQTFVLDPDMRERLAQLNPKASARMTSRLLEAHERQYWQPDEATLEALRQAGEDLEDRLEGIPSGAAA